MRIIIADDEPLILQGIERTARAALPAAQLDAFPNGDAALEFARNHAVDVAFIDIEMPGMNGLALAAQLQALYPKVNIVFITSHSQYAIEAHNIRASGYLLKPVLKEDIVREIENLRHSVEDDTPRRLRVVTFGNFAVMDGEEHIHFRYSKTLEMMAYLVDRHGAMCTNGELQAILWEDNSSSAQTANYLRQLRKDLNDTLQSAGYDDVIIQQRGKCGVRVERLACDMYEWLDAEPTARKNFNGEYMAQYSWAEVTLGWLNRLASAETIKADRHD